MMALFSDPTFLQVAIPGGIAAVAAAGGGAKLFDQARAKRAAKEERRKFGAELWEETFYGWREWLQSVVNGTSTDTPLEKARGIRNLFETSQEWLPDHSVDYAHEGRMYLTYYPSMLGDHFLKMVPVGAKAAKIEASMNGSLMWTRNHWDVVISYLEVVPEGSLIQKMLDEYVIANAAQLLLNYRFSPQRETEHSTDFVDQAVKRQRELRFLWKRLKPELAPWTEASKKPRVSAIEHAQSLQLDREVTPRVVEPKPTVALPPNAQSKKAKSLVGVSIPQGEFNEEEYALVERFVNGADDLEEEKVVAGNSLLQKLAIAANAEKEAEGFNEPARSQVLGLAQKNRQTAFTGLLGLLGDDISNREAEVLKSLRVDEKYLEEKVNPGP